MGLYLCYLNGPLPALLQWAYTCITSLGLYLPYLNGPTPVLPQWASVFTSTQYIMKETTPGRR